MTRPFLAVLVALLVLPMCKSETDDPFSKRVAQGTSAKKHQPAEESTESTLGPVFSVGVPQGRTETPPCRIADVKVRDLSPDSLYSDTDFEAWATARAAQEFGVLTGDPSHFHLQMQIAVRKSQAHSDTLEDAEEKVFLGASGHMLAHTVPLNTVLEGKYQKDVELPTECAETMNTPECREALHPTLMEPALDAILGHLKKRCKMEHESDLSPFLKDPDPLVRQDACQLSGDPEYKTHEANLVRALEDDNRKVVLSCLGALGRTGSDESVPRIVKAASRAHPDVVRQCAVTLYDIGTPLARRYLEDWRTGHPNPSIRQLAGALLEDSISDPDNSEESHEQK